MAAVCGTAANDIFEGESGELGDAAKQVEEGAGHHCRGRQRDQGIAQRRQAPQLFVVFQTAGGGCRYATPRR